MPDDATPTTTQLPMKVPNWVWGAMLIGGGGSLGAGGMGLIGEPAATKAELSTVETKLEALDDNLDDRMDRMERAMDRLTFAVGGTPMPSEGP